LLHGEDGRAQVRVQLPLWQLSHNTAALLSTPASQTITDTFEDVLAQPSSQTSLVFWKKAIICLQGMSHFESLHSVSYEVPQSVLSYSGFVVRK